MVVDVSKGNVVHLLISTEFYEIEISEYQVKEKVLGAILLLLLCCTLGHDHTIQCSALSLSPGNCIVLFLCFLKRKLFHEGET